LQLVRWLHFVACMLATLTTLVFICAPISPPGLTMSRIDEPPTREESEVVVDKGYAAQILAVDALGVGLLFGAAMNENEAGAWLGLGTMALGPALVHASHNRGGEAIASALMRPTLTIGGIYAGFAMASDDCRELCGLGEAFIGGLVGYGTAVIIDAAYLAREKRAPRDASWMPTVNATSSSVQLGVGGRF
jgi:hypothetical protein